MFKFNKEFCFSCKKSALCKNRLITNSKKEQYSTFFGQKSLKSKDTSSKICITIVKITYKINKKVNIFIIIAQGDTVVGNQM